MAVASRKSVRQAAIAALAIAAGVLWAGTGQAQDAKPADAVLRVCADPNNMPFSNEREEGFENKLAELVAADLGKSVEYIWWAQRRGFVRSTLNAGMCDVIMGVPTRLEMLAVTRPYYRSTYVFVSRTDRHLDVSSLDDERLRTLTVGVHLIGDDGANTPPADALGQAGIVDNVRGFTVYGDYRQPNPPARLIDAVASGDVEIATAWGPLAGYFAIREPVPMTVVPITGTERFAPLSFQFNISMGVRHADKALRASLDEVIARRGGEIRALLESYGVPLLPIEEPAPDDDEDDD